MVLVALLLITAGVGVWTYRSEIGGLISPGPNFSSPSPAPAPVSSILAAVPATGPVANPKLLARTSDDLQPRGVGAADAKGKPLPFNLVEEPATPEEPEGNLPEKLSTIKILEGDEIKRIEKQLVARQKLDEASVIRDYLNSSQISGVRVAGPMSKMLFNGEVYQVGETVRENPRITIQKITTARLIFEDQQGNQYSVKY